MESGQDFWGDVAALAWQVELGADEAIGDAPVNRYEMPEAAPEAAPAPAAAPPAADNPGRPAAPVVAPEALDAPALARAAAEAAPDLAALATAMEAFELCELKKGAQSFVFSDGTPGARLMVVGEAPGQEEDRQGRPFVGQAGQLLDRMLAAIGRDRTAPAPDRGVYITNVLPWRPPANRTPDAAEIAMMLPFLERHIALAAPDALLLLGNTPCQALLGRGGITRMRGQWTDVLGRPALPSFHPAYLLRNPAAKRDSWADLLAVQARLRGG